MLRAEAHDDLMFTAQLCDPRYRPSRFHCYVANLLQRVAAGEIKRLVLTVPPQHGKSRLVTVEFPTWMFGRDPTKRFIVASYARDLSLNHSRAARERMSSAEYQFLFDTRLDPRGQSAEQWNTDGGGFYKAVSVGSAMTGHPADIIVIDDPHKDYAEAHSLRARELVWDWYRSVAYTRLSPNGAIIVIMTRWHVDDLVGRLLDPARGLQFRLAGVKSEKWHVINMPALAEDGDLLGRKPGEPLWPEFFSAEKLKATRETVGSYIWSALYCGRPVAKTGNIIKVDSFKFIAPEQVPDGVRWVRFWDLATTEESAGKGDPDRTAGAKVGIDQSGNCYIADMACGRWRWPVARERIRALAEAEGILVGVEAQGGFETAYQNLREVLPPTVKSIPLRVETDKLTRALPWIALAEAGKLFIVAGEWNIEFIAEAEAFPTGQHDDMIDAISGGYAVLTRTRRIMVA